MATLDANPEHEAALSVETTSRVLVLTLAANGSEATIFCINTLRTSANSAPIPY